MKDVKCGELPCTISNIANNLKKKRKFNIYNKSAIN